MAGSDIEPAIHVQCNARTRWAAMPEAWWVIVRVAAGDLRDRAR